MLQNSASGRMQVALIILLLVVIASSLFVLGSPFPAPTGPAVNIVPPSPGTSKKSVQVGTFTGRASTPAPTSISIPTPTLPQQPTCGVANPYVLIIKQQGETCCVVDGAANSCGECCEGVTCSTAFGIASDTYPYWCDAKPVIYLYPKKVTQVNVKVTVPGKIIESIPLYPKGGWKNITAHPDGTLLYNQKLYRELFYEASITRTTPPKEGFVIPISNLEPTLKNITTKLGLIDYEQREFLKYWVPKLKSLGSSYMFVSVFDAATKDVIDHVAISPQPDTFIQFIMYYKPLKQPYEVKPLNLPDTPLERKGFTAVEWGGIVDF